MSNLPLNNIDQTKTLMDAIVAFMAHCNVIQAEYWERNGYTFGPAPTFKVEYADKWAKVYKVEKNNDGTERECIYAFVAMVDFANKTMGVVHAGGVYKPASYKLPAKHARGNVLHKDTWNCAGPNGIAYLR